MINKGQLWIMEGGDCSGKKTQAEMLVNTLNQAQIPAILQPDPLYNTPAGNIVGFCYLGKNPQDPETGLSNPHFNIRDMPDVGSWFGDPDKVDPKLACLYYAACRRGAKNQIMTHLNQGSSIIGDRYVTSNMGHQCGKLPTSEERVRMRDWIEHLEYDLLEMPRPDKVIFLDMPYEVGLKLRENRKEKPDGHETEEHLSRAEGAYRELAVHYGWHKIQCSDDGKEPRTPEAIHADVWRLVMTEWY